MTTTFKIRQANVLGAEHIRRINLKNSDLSLAGLRERVSKLFSLNENEVWHFKYKDDEGDMISVTEEYELQDLLNWHWAKPDGKTSAVRLELVVQLKKREFTPQQSREDFAALCDNTDVTLRFGAWWHVPGTTQDLCQSELEKLGDEARSRYVLISKVADLGADAHQYRVRRCGRRRTGCGPSLHMGWCDDSGVALLPGNGWWHRPGTTQDLCQSSYDERTRRGEDLLSYILINKDEDLGAEKDRYNQAKAAIDILFSGCARTNEPPVEPKLEVQILAGPSVPAGSPVTPGSRFVPVWEVRNTSDRMWSDVRLRPVHPNPFQVKEEGFEVPLLQTGESGLVTADILVPTKLAGKLVEAAFEFVDAAGRAFGGRLQLNVNVQPITTTDAEDDWEIPELVDENDLVRTLRDMGFDDDAKSLAAIRASQGDVNAAALRLLRDKN
eukprot:c21334_g1_i1.p1 GENE.c21334_g1_i1~~c21334_g1_i1.p1  ORF type:complete len:441 (+),score=89.35 c21334_g1_i1:105-1427(+)